MIPWVSDPVMSSLQASYAFGMSREYHVKRDAVSRGREGKRDFSANGTICILLHPGEVEMKIFYRSCPSRLYILLWLASFTINGKLASGLSNVWLPKTKRKLILWNGSMSHESSFYSQVTIEHWKIRMIKA